MRPELSEKTGIVIAIFSCRSFLPKMYPARVMKADFPSPDELLLLLLLLLWGCSVAACLPAELACSIWVSATTKSLYLHYLWQGASHGKLVATLIVPLTEDFVYMDEFVQGPKFCDTTVGPFNNSTKSVESNTLDRVGINCLRFAGYKARIMQQT